MAKCAVTMIGAAIIILGRSLRGEAATRWVSMKSKMGMDYDKGADSRWALMTRRMVTDAVEQVRHADYKLLYSI